MSEKMEEYRARRGEVSKEVWNRPGYREKMTEKMKEVMARPDYKAKRSMVMKRIWDDPEYRKQMSEMQKRTKNTPESKAKASASQKARWAKIPKEQRKIYGFNSLSKEAIHELRIKDWADDDRRNARWEMMRERGTDEKAAKLSDDQVREVRRLLAMGERVGKIAGMFQVSATIISYIKSGKTYRHVKEE